MAIELILEASESIPRQLIVSLSASERSLSIRMYGPQGPSPTSHTICFSVGVLTEWYLDVKGRVLWHNSAAFDLTENDVIRIEKVLVPHGLDVYNVFPIAAPLGSESAKVGAYTAPPPGVRGATPLPVCTDRGTFGLTNCTAAHALTANENH